LEIAKLKPSLVVGTHFVSDRSFVKSSDPKFNYLNWYMGAGGIKDFYKNDKVILGLVGHTHRYGREELEGTPVYNVSDDWAPYVFDITKQEDNDYSVELIDGIE
jgi:Icc-related predicted phosphoesterase